MLQLRAMSGSVVSLQLGSGLISMTTTARVCVSVHGSCYHQRLCRCLESGMTPEAMLVLNSQLLRGPCRSGWPALPPGAMVTLGPKMESGTMSGSLVLP